MTAMFSQFQLDGYLTRKVIPYFFTMQKMLKHLESRIKYGQKGDNVVWNLRLSAQTLKSYGNYATFSAGDVADYAQASLPWASVYVARSLAGLELEKQGRPGSLDDGTVLSMESQALMEIKDDFYFRLSTEMFTGDGLTLNGGSGVTPTGVTQSVRTSAGTYAGISQSTVDAHDNQRFAATSGPSGNAKQDAWWIFLNAIAQSMRAKDSNGRTYRPNVALGNRTHWVDIKNKGFSQNTQVGANVKGVETIEGIELEVDDDATSDAVYFLPMECFDLYTTASSKNDMFKLRVVDNIPDHVHEGDKALVMRSCPIQIANRFPKGCTVVTSWT